MEKFRKCVDYSSKRIAKEKVSEILHILEDLENLKNIRILMDLLR
jgi:hypothetical protein